MSWLNSSLNSLKGQITSFAQEVLAEDPIQEEEINPVQALEESQKRNEELNLLCASKDSEIAALRRQIVEFQAKCAESGRSSKSSLEKNASLEDSWIWEPENVLSDSSVKNDHEANSETSSGGEMITIPLDIATATESSSYEKLCKTSEENQKLKKLVQENAALSEKVAQLRAKNKILNENLEELDTQHNAVIQKLLALKDELQEKFHKVSEDYEKLKTVHENEALNHERELDAVKKNLATYLSENEELKRSLDSLEECILKQTTENVNVKANLELKETQLLELIEKIENWEGQNHQQHHEKRDDESVIDKLQKENDNLRKFLEEIGLDVDELKNGKELKNVFVKKHSVEDGFIVLEDGDLTDGISWKQKYDELLLVKNELLDKLNESNQFPSTHKELEAEVELLRNTAISLDEQNKTYVNKINSLQESQLLQNAAINEKREQMDTKMNLEIKIALLEKEKSILQSENQINLARLDELKKVQTIDPEDYEKLKSENEQLQESFSAANEEFMEYQEDQTKIRTKLEMRVKQLETEVLETQNKLQNKASNNEELELKVALLKKEKSILESDLLTNLERIEKLKISKTIDNEEYETIIEKNRQLQEDFESANEEFMEYQEEQAKIRGELEAKVEHLENQIKECKILSSAVSMDNRCDKQTVKTIETDEQLQKEDHHDDVCKNFEQKVECLEKEISDASKSKQELVRQLEEYKQFAVKSSELQQKLDDIHILNEKYKGDIEKLKHKIEKCEANASDVESKLMMENVDLQKQLNDMESSMNQIQSDTRIANNSLVYSFDEIKELFSTYLQTNLMKTDKDTVEAGFKSIRDKIWKIDILERNLKQMSDEISRLVAEKSAIEHEKNTLQADVLNYEIECGELMKNNEILLNELDNYKRNKLETIHENNEDSIVILEKQLEDCNNLNRTLEDEYKELNQRIDDMENEKTEQLSKIQSLQDINNNLNVTVKDLKLQLDAIEAEKCNLIFEINEMKTDDKKSAIDSQMQEYRNKMSGLEAQLGRLSKDHADLVAAMQSQQNNLMDYKREAEATILRLEKSLQGKDILIATKESEIKRLSTEHESMEKALLEGEHQSTTTNYTQLQTDNEQLFKKLENLSSEKIPTSSSCDHEKQITQLNEEIASLKQIKLKSDDISLSPLRTQIEALNNEKAELIQTVTIKHNENLQYYMEIQRLGQLLQVEMEKSQNSNCKNCTRLQNDIASMGLKTANEVEKLKDQINFLMEKSDILTTNLLTEQTNQKLLHEEKSELVEQNSNLKKDLERLRHHLVELEDGHTQETLEMQKVIDETKAKMYELEEHASNSSTAYTSASIRANQHAETLQAQYQLVCQQRDEIAAQLSTAEDHELKNQAALVNLQCALEQFQKEREKDIQIATHRIRNELQTEKEKQKRLLQDIASLNQQLTDANQGLLAAARLSDQLEMSQVTISSLKEEITNLQNKNEILYEKLRITESSQADKIEITLVKSLIIGYIVSSNPNDKSQILKMITIVLGFNQAETDKIGLNKNQTGWFGGLLNVGNSVTHGTDSLARAFVNFLEAESRPRDESSEMPNLLNIVSEGSSSSTLPSSSAKSDERKLSEPRTNQSAVQPILLNENVLEQFAPTRNSSSILKDILNDS